MEGFAVRSSSDAFLSLVSCFEETRKKHFKGGWGLAENNRITNHKKDKNARIT